MIRRVGCAVLVAASLTAQACGGGDDGSAASKDDRAVAETATPSPEPTPTPKPEIELAVADRTVYSDAVTLKGRVRPKSAKVSINGKLVKVAHGHWSMPVTLTKKGASHFRIKASRKGFVGDATTQTITRRLSSAELAAIRAKEEADFKASAETIAYAQLNKDADSYRGRRVVYRGQILQIQQDGDYGGVILLSVTDEGYGFWTDNIWVDYSGKVQGADEDIITVYGVVKGSKSYETQVGGETYVPRVRAKYIDE